MKGGVKLGKRYTREEIERMIQPYFDEGAAAKPIAELFRDDCLNYRSVLKNEPNVSCVDCISELLSKNISKLMEIQPVDYKGKAYDRGDANEAGLDGKLKKVGGACYPEGHESGRKEEYIAKFMNGRTYTAIGKVVGVQIPLKQKNKKKEQKNEQEKDVGKIDMLSYGYDERRKKYVVSVLELKEPKSDETMLRAVMEALTYFKQLDVKELIDSFKEIGAPHDDICFAISPIVFKGVASVPASGEAYRELVTEKSSHVELRSFIQMLNEELMPERAFIRPLYIDVEEKKNGKEKEINYVVHEIEIDG